MENLKKLRTEKKLTQYELASALNISQAAIHFYERGDKQASCETAIKIADFFGVTVDYLLGREPESGLIYVHKSPELSAEESRIVELYNRLSPEKKHEAEIWLKTMYEIENESAGAHPRKDLG